MQHSNDVHYIKQIKITLIAIFPLTMHLRFANSYTRNRNVQKKTLQKSLKKQLNWMRAKKINSKKIHRIELASRDKK